MSTRLPAREALLTGDVRPVILRLGAPCVLAMLSSSAGALLDAFFVAGSGEASVAAVGLSTPLTTLLQAVGFTLGMGAGSFASRSLGAGDEESARRAASSALLAALLLPAALCAAGLCFMRPLLALLGATPATFDPGARYARYVLLSGPLLCANLVLGSLLRGEGRVWAHCAASLSGGALGAALGWALTARLGWGLRGVGVAMLAREALTLAALAASTARSGLRPSPRLATARPAVWADIMRSGLPTLLRQGLAGVCGVLLNRQSAAFGEAALAGMGLAVRALAPITSAVIGFGQGFQPVCGFACGAGDAGRIRDAYRFCQKTACACLALAGAALLPLAGPLLAASGAPEAAARFGARVLRAQAPALFAQGAVILMNVLTQSMGQTVRASLIATSRQGYLFIPAALLLPRLFGETGLALCQTVSDLLALPVCLLLARDALPVARKGEETPALTFI